MANGILSIFETAAHRTDPNLWVMSRSAMVTTHKHNTVKPMEDAIVTPSKKMSSGQIKHQNNADLFVFFSSQGIVHLEFVPKGQTVNKTFYLEVLG